VGGGGGGEGGARPRGIREIRAPSRCPVYTDGLGLSSGLNTPSLDDDSDGRGRGGHVKRFPYWAGPGSHTRGWPLHPACIFSGTVVPDICRGGGLTG